MTFSGVGQSAPKSFQKLLMSSENILGHFCNSPALKGLRSMIIKKCVDMSENRWKSMFWLQQY